MHLQHSITAWQEQGDETSKTMSLLHCDLIWLGFALRYWRGREREQEGNNTSHASFVELHIVYEHIFSIYLFISFL